MFIIAFSLLTIAVVLVLFLVRRWRGRPQPSLISQSIDRIAVTHGSQLLCLHVFAQADNRSFVPWCGGCILTFPASSQKSGA